MSTLSVAAPPTPQEVSRKLSLHAVAKSPRIPKPATSGAESDTESVLLSPDMPPPSPFLPLPGAQPAHALHSIAERARAESGEDDSDEEADEAATRWAAAPKADVEDVVIKSGYLYKKGERRKTWKKRWFVLRTSHLVYYKTNAEYRLLRLLNLADVHTCVAVTLKRHDNTFGLVSPTRTYYLQAGNAAEMQGWITAINEQRDITLTSPRNSVINPQPSIGMTSSQPINIPKASSGSNSMMMASSPGYGITTSESEDDASGSPNRQVTRKRSNSRAPAMPLTAGPHGQGVTFAPATPRIPGTDRDPSKVVLSGYLMKCGSKRRHWRKRWFVLTGEKLVYAGSHMDTKAHREVPLSQVLDALEVDLEQQGHRAGAPLASPIVPTTPMTRSPGEKSDRDPYGQHTFKIVTTKRTLLLCAPGEDEEIKWLSAVRALIARRGAPASNEGVPYPSTPSAVVTSFEQAQMQGQGHGQVQAHGGGPSSGSGSGGLSGPAPHHAAAASGSSGGGQGSSILRGKVRRLSISGTSGPEEDGRH